MSEERWLRWSERLYRGLLRAYPVDFREEMGEEVVGAYREWSREAYGRGGVVALARVWSRAVVDSLRNGVGERLRPGVVWRRGGDWGRDAERVLRRLLREPAFAMSVVATLTVGLGGFGVVYTVVDKVLFEPPPYERPDDLYFVWRAYPWASIDRSPLRGLDIPELEAVGGVVEGAVGLQRRTVTLTADSGGEPEEVGLMVSSANLFEVLGVNPVLGRGFVRGEEGPGGARVAVLGHDLWRRRFGGDPAVLGREIRLDGEPYTVIGVAGRDFRFVMHTAEGAPAGADVYVPFGYSLADTSPYQGAYSGLIRVRAGSSPVEVAAALAVVGSRIDDRDYYQGNRGLRLFAVGMQEELVAPVRPALAALGLAAAFLVVVLMLNLAVLLLGRVMRREREFAVSRALGANRLVVARAMWIEGGILGLVGGVGGAALAVWGTRLVVALAPLDLPRRDAIAVDMQVGLVVAGVGVLVGLLAGAAPSVWAARARVATLLGSASVRGGGGGRGRLRRAMVVAQVAASLVLLTAGGLVVRSFDRLLRTDPGFEPAGALMLRVVIPRALYGSAATRLHERIEQELGSLRGVKAVGATSAAPLSKAADWTSVAFPGAPGNVGDPQQDNPLIDVIYTRAEYFAAAGIRLLEGRDFSPGAAARGGARRGEAVIDRTLARRFFPNGGAVGATMVLLGDSLTVVGVVDHARMHDVQRDGRPQAYVRAEGEFAIPTLTWLLRTDDSALRLAGDVRAAVHRVDPGLAIADFQSMDAVVAESMREQRLMAVLISGFSVGALLLAALGLYGVVAGSVVRRRHELAVRMAVGADHGRVFRLMLGEGAALVGLGVLLGAPGIWLSAWVVRGVLVDVSPFDPLTLVAVACGLAIVALGACYFPARRVLDLEPARVLGSD
ncbi:MAG TPA: ADOP family duplicated permease [Longimicrobiales bacterium]